MLENRTRKIRGHRVAIIATAALVCGFGVSAKAVIIAPGQLLNTTGETSPAFGAPILDTGNIPFTSTNSSFTGLLDTRVYTDPSTGDLDFAYLFSNSVSSNDYILTFATSSYSGLTTDADYITGTGSSSPATVQRNVPNSGGTLNFSFPTGVAPGTSAAEILVKTNAINYSLTGFASFQDGGNVTITAPAPVPEPATAAIAGISMLGLGMRRRRAS